MSLGFVGAILHTILAFLNLIWRCLDCNIRVTCKVLAFTPVCMVTFLRLAFWSSKILAAQASEWRPPAVYIYIFTSENNMNNFFYNQQTHHPLLPTFYHLAFFILFCLNVGKACSWGKATLCMMRNLEIERVPASGSFHVPFEMANGCRIWIGLHTKYTMKT